MSTAPWVRGTALQWLTMNETCYQADSRCRTTTKLRQNTAVTDGHCQDCECLCCGSLGGAPVPAVWPALCCHWRQLSLSQQPARAPSAVGQCGAPPQGPSGTLAAGGAVPAPAISGTGAAERCMGLQQPTSSDAHLSTQTDFYFWGCPKWTLSAELSGDQQEHHWTEGPRQGDVGFAVDDTPFSCVTSSQRLSRARLCMTGTSAMLASSPSAACCALSSHRSPAQTHASADD